jgi:hypothetical protein
MELPEAPNHRKLGTSHQAASLNLILPLPEIEMKSYGVQAIDVVLGKQEPQQTQFYVYPKSAEIVP